MERIASTASLGIDISACTQAASTDEAMTSFEIRIARKTAKCIEARSIEDSLGAALTVQSAQKAYRGSPSSAQIAQQAPRSSWNTAKRAQIAQQAWKHR
jgi:hypothetical protein